MSDFKLPMSKPQLITHLNKMQGTITSFQQAIIDLKSTMQANSPDTASINMMNTIQDLIPMMAKLEKTTHTIDNTLQSKMMISNLPRVIPSQS